MLTDHITIPRWWRQYKAHSSTLVETIQSTTFRARGDYIKHTIPCLQITLQFHARGDDTKQLMETIQSTAFRACGEHTKQIAENTLPYIQRYDTYDKLLHITLQNMYNITI